MFVSAMSTTQYRTVEIVERAPFIKWVFEQYAWEPHSCQPAIRSDRTRPHNSAHTQTTIGANRRSTFFKVLRNPYIYKLQLKIAYSVS